MGARLPAGTAPPVLVSLLQSSFFASQLHLRKERKRSVLYVVTIFNSTLPRNPRRPVKFVFQINNE